MFTFCINIHLCHTIKNITLNYLSRLTQLDSLDACTIKTEVPNKATVQEKSPLLNDDTNKEDVVRLRNGEQEGS